jgi:hypothetical protein
MIGQYLSNNNETATVAFRQNFCQLNSLPVALLPFHARVVPVNWSIELTTDGAALIDPSLPASKSIGIFRTLEQQHIFLVHARLARTRRFLKSADTCVGD